VQKLHLRDTIFYLQEKKIIVISYLLSIRLPWPRNFGFLLVFCVFEYFGGLPFRKYVAFLSGGELLELRLLDKK
jgi:hypothetical protein